MRANADATKVLTIRTKSTGGDEFSQKFDFSAAVASESLDESTSNKHTHTYEFRHRQPRIWRQSMTVTRHTKHSVVYSVYAETEQAHSLPFIYYHK